MSDYKGSILLVDDEPLVLEMFATFLDVAGYDVVVASNAMQALSCIERGYFEAIVCDVMLEDLDGFDILTIARKKNPSAAVVLITGSPSEVDSRRAAEQSAAYLSKPIGGDVLLDAIAEVQNTEQSMLFDGKSKQAPARAASR